MIQKIKHFIPTVLLGAFIAAAIAGNAPWTVWLFIVPYSALVLFLPGLDKLAVQCARSHAVHVVHILERFNKQ